MGKKNKGKEDNKSIERQRDSKITVTKIEFIQADAACFTLHLSRIKTKNLKVGNLVVALPSKNSFTENTHQTIQHNARP